jgi:23S rRNA (adenine2503-C2)-methyltransferase
VWHAAKQLGNVTHQQRRITNIVMMGMGEPLLNFDNVVTAMSLMRDDLGFGLASKRVTLSTAGVVPKIDKLGEIADVSLAVSLHAPNDALRTQLMPINKRWGIDELLDACARYVARKPRATITFEYTLMKGINDTPALARQLVKLMRRLPAKVNLIPFNSFPGTQYARSDATVIRDFQTILLNAGVQAMVRRTRGEDIDAACGQLKGKVADRTRRHAEFQRRIETATQPESHAHAA